MPAQIYQQCTRCIMDTTDPDIIFDEKGHCNHCTYALHLWEGIPKDPEEIKRRLQEKVQEIKNAGAGKRYDCVIGLSGGVDSSYIAYLTSKLGLRPLAVHLDNAWNSELSVKNIENIVRKLNIDLYTHILDWDEFRSLQIAFLKASVPDGEVPTDHAIIALINQMAIKEGISYIISGSNLSTESILPHKWSAGHLDWKYIRSIQRRFGDQKLKSYPHTSFWHYYFYYPFIKKIKSVRLLDYVDYHKEEAMSVLENELDWKYYGGKHYESIYTRFYQSYFLPTKFNFDKRKAHLSSLICSRQLTREDALKEFEKPVCDPHVMEEDKLFVIKKLGLNEREFESIMNSPHRFYGDYPSQKPLMDFIKPIYKKIKQATGFTKRQGF